MLRSFSPLLLLAILLVPELNGQEYVVADEFKVSSAVAPGLIQHPVMATIDDRGRMFVAENAGVNLKKDELLKETPSSIRLLIDTDQDGVFDKATTFADKLTFPQGALWIYDSLFVMSPPSLWRFADEDGDGVAEVREELATGFDFTGNAADVHGPFLHPNGRIYWCHGRKGHSVPDNDTGEILYEGKGARIWSSQLSGGELEPFAGGGMDNPVEIDFTDEGEIIGTVNLFYGRPRGDTLTHWAYGGAYPRYDQGQVVAEFKRTGDLLTEVHNFGHVAVSGMCRYRSGHLNPDWADQWLVSHFNTSRITRTRVVREGAGFIAAETEEIFKLNNPDAHLTDILEDLNGDLLAIDTGGWFRIGCPTSHIAKPEVAGGIYRISRAGESYQAPSYPNWPRLTSEAVSGFLGAEEYWLRERAITELAVRGDPALPELRRLLQASDTTVTARRNAVWTLARMKFSESVDMIYDALVDPDPGVRQAACNAISVTRTWQNIAANQPAEREIELERNRTITGALAGIVRGDEARVARDAAVALGRMGETRAIGAILGRLGRVEQDRMLEHALIYALIDIDDEKATREGLKIENPTSISGVLRALDQMPSATLEVLDILAHLESENETLRKTVTSLATKHREWDAALANRFLDWEGNLTENRLAVLGEIVPQHAAAPPIQDFLSTLLTSEDEETRRFALGLIAGANEVAILPEWESTLRSYLSGTSDMEFRRLSLEILARDPEARFQEELQALAENNSLPRLTRIRAARALAKQQAVLSELAFTLLTDILESEEDVAIRSEAFGILNGTRLTKERRTRIASLASNFSPIEMQALLQLFRKIDDEAQAATLAAALAASPSFASLDHDRLRQIFRPFDPAVFEQVGKRIAEVEAETAQRSERIEALLEGITDANPELGKTVFESGKGSCLVCHRIGETGGQVGPDLSTIGRIRSARDLFESVLYPNESIARDFNTYEIRLKGGEPSRVGLIESRSAGAIVLIDPAGQKHSIPRAQIASIVEIPTSLMPAGLEHTLTKKELRDLIAYMLGKK